MEKILWSNENKLKKLFLFQFFSVGLHHQTTKHYQKMENSIKLIEISAEQAINHARNEYNPYEWKKEINQFKNGFVGAKFYEYNNQVFTIVKATTGIAYLFEISYSHSINNGGFKTFVLKNDELIKYPLKLSHSDQDMNLAAALSNQGLVIANVYLSI